MKTLTLVPSQVNLLAQAEGSAPEQVEGALVVTSDEVAVPAGEEQAAVATDEQAAPEQVAVADGKTDGTITTTTLVTDEPEAPQGQEQPSSMSFWIMLAIMGVIFWFFIIRPQSKRQKAIQKFQNSIVPGTQVYTQGGIVGKVVAVNEADNTLKIEVSKDVTITVFRNCVFSSANPQQ